MANSLVICWFESVTLIFSPYLRLFLPLYVISSVSSACKAVPRMAPRFVLIENDDNSLQRIGRNGGGAGERVKEKMPYFLFDLEVILIY